MILKIMSFCLWFLVWCGLCRPVDMKNLIIGVAASLFVTYMAGDLIIGLEDKKRARKYGAIDNLKRIMWFLWYIAVFVWECLKANIDVAYRVLHPGLPIRPGLVKVKVDLRSDIGLTLLANSITLTPGTTSVDVDKEKGILYIHWIYVRDVNVESGKLPVVDRFENILKRIFE